MIIFGDGGPGTQKKQGTGERGPRKNSKIPLTNKNLYLKSHDDFRGQGSGTENFKKSKIPLTNKNLYLKSHDDFRGQGPGENFKNSKIPLVNKKLYLKLYDESCEPLSEYLKSEK
jgi:hypothetical protein